MRAAAAGGRRAVLTANAIRYPGATLTIDLDAVAANWRTLADRAGTASCGGVVKADGYGLGAERSRPLCRTRVADTFRRYHRRGHCTENLCPAMQLSSLTD